MAPLVVPDLAGDPCHDGVVDGDETATDCGGSCAGCANGQACHIDGDCQSAQCIGGLCADWPTCTDGVKNEDESDVDCGGHCPRCAVGAACLAGDDCTTLHCRQGRCIVPPAVKLSLAAPVFTSLGHDVYDVAIGDFNGDGKQDAVLVGGPGLAFLRGRGDGTFLDPVVLTQLGGTLAATDLDGDGLSDLVFGDIGFVYVMYGQRPGLRPPMAVAIAGQADAIAVGDVNGDHRPDIAYAATNKKDGGVVLATAARAYQEGPSFPGFLDYLHGLGVGDLDGDGKADVLTADLMHPPTVYAGGAKGALPLLWMNAPLDTSGFPALTLGHFDGDRRPDVVMTSFNYDASQCYRGDGKGGLRPAVAVVHVKGAPLTAVTADFDGDGWDDVAILENSDANSRGGVRVVRGHNDCTFAEQIDTRLGGLVEDLAVGDLNGDGYPDLVAALRMGQQGYSVILNTTH